MRFEDVTVRYRDGAAPALDGSAWTCRRAGGSRSSARAGAGKSTLAAVLTGAVQPATGRVTLDGTTFGVRRATLPRAVGGLLAEAYVFHATVRENLLLGRAGRGRGGADRGDRGGRAAGLGTRAAGRLGHPGRRGGRAALRRPAAAARAGPGAARRARRCWCSTSRPRGSTRPPPTRCSRRRWQRRPRPRRSVLLITHRLSGLDELDEIVVLDGGRMVQRGAHADLVADPGWYRDQWLLQEAAERGYLALATLTADRGHPGVGPRGRVAGWSHARAEDGGGRRAPAGAGRALSGRRGSRPTC